MRVTSETARDISGYFWKGDRILYVKDFGGGVPMGLASEVKGNTWRMRGTDHVPIRCAALTGKVGGQVETGAVLAVAGVAKEKRLQSAHGA